MPAVLRHHALIAAACLCLIACADQAAVLDNLPTPWTPAAGPAPGTGGSSAAGCHDGVQNHDETGVDCGGSCEPCSDCVSGPDCPSGRCSDGACLPATCADGVLNQGERETDCGGPCTPCRVHCSVDDACTPGRCVDGECEQLSCSDRIKNGDETDTDCGGSCPRCNVGRQCASANDCVTKSCVSGSCRAATCTDGALNGQEADVDCGSNCSKPCADYARCVVDLDCLSGNCVDQSCQPVFCSDGQKNGAESDIDCGGNRCTACADGKRCTAASDCSSRNCASGRCLTPSCSDQLKNGDEADVDCGGSCPEACVVGSSCTINADCESFACIGSSCRAETCSDGRRNGSETGVDCGGTCPSACIPGDERFGINIDPDSVSGNPSGITLAETNVGFIRISYKDYAIANPSVLDPVPLARVRNKIDEVALHGIETMIVLNYETFWGDYSAHANDLSWWNTYRANFVLRAAAVAKALGEKVTAYEIWNEPDHPSIPGDPYQTGIPAARFAELLRDTSAAIRRYSRATIITGGADSGDPNYLRQTATATGGILHADAIGLHPYGRRPDPDFPDASWGFGTIADSVRDYAALGKPIWITEMGVKYDEAAPAGATLGEQRYMQGEFLRRTFQRLVELEASVDRTAWFCWSDTMVDKFGILNKQGVQTFSHTAFKNTAKPHPSAPSLTKACFSPYTAPDGTASVQATFTVQVPDTVWTQPLGSSPRGCAFYEPGETAYGLFPSLRGAWRVAAGTSGSTVSGQEYPWRFSLTADQCQASAQQDNRVLVAQSGTYTVTGLIKLAPGDDGDTSKFTGGLVREGIEWTQRDVGCQ